MKTTNHCIFPLALRNPGNIFMKVTPSKAGVTSFTDQTCEPYKVMKGGASGVFLPKKSALEPQQISRR